MELRNPEQTVEEDHPSAEGLENFLRGWLLELVVIWSPQVHLFLPPNTLCQILPRRGYACISRNLKPFYICSASGDGSSIFVSLCEQIPKMSNPLQASL